MPSVNVKYYHAGLPLNDRALAHREFVTGKAPVIVATTAFGMGIDKPDIRRVIHWGVPKSMEEYYQQIGRAGRDGLQSECYMFHRATDFTMFKADFWNRNVPEEQRPAKDLELDKFRAFCESSTNCKRHDILVHFNEKPKYDFCGNCNNCLGRGSPVELRDYTKETDAILQAVKSLGQQWSSKSKLLPEARKNFARDNAKLKLPGVQLFDYLITPLVENQYLARSIRKGSFGGGGGRQARETTWETLVVGHKKRTSKNVMLRPPQSVLDYEDQQLKQKNEKLARYEKQGLNLTLVPQEELDAGTGPILKAMIKWHQMITRCRESDRPGDVEKANHHEELFRRVQNWRSRHAEELGIAPVNIMPEHFIFLISYSKPRTAADLKAMGIQVTGIQSLADLMSASVEELGLTNTNEDTEMVAGNKMILPNGSIVCTPIPPFNPIPPKKPSNKPKSYDVSWEMFEKEKKSPGAIAVERNLQGNTIVSHLLTAMNMSKPLDLGRLYNQLSTDNIVLNENVWNELEKVAVELNWGDLSSTAVWGVGTGINNLKLMKGYSYDMCRLVKGGFLNDIIEKDYKERDEVEQKTLRYWTIAVERWSLLKRARVHVKFEESTGGNVPSKKRSISDDDNDHSSKSESSTSQPSNKKQRM